MSWVSNLPRNANRPRCPIGQAAGGKLASLGSELTGKSASGRSCLRPPQGDGEGPGSSYVGRDMIAIPFPDHLSLGRLRLAVLPALSAACRRVTSGLEMELLDPYHLRFP